MRFTGSVRQSTMASPSGDLTPLSTYSLSESPARLDTIIETVEQPALIPCKLNLQNPMALADDLAKYWQDQLTKDYPEESTPTRDSIINWLLGQDRQRFEAFTPDQAAIAQSAMEYRYRILRQRYLNVGPERAYKHLITRLGSLVILRNKIRTWVALSRDRQRAVNDVLQEVIQELLHSDRYIQSQIAWISECTQNPRLRNSLLMTSIEEYCLRPIRNQPLLVYRFVNYLRRSQRGGMTHVPEGDLVRLVSEEIDPSDSDDPVSLLDNQAVAKYQEEKAFEEQQALRNAVGREFEAYLVENVGEEAAQWLKLYLSGLSQEAIAQQMEKPIKQIYRLREKVSYHAIRVFAVKSQPHLVASWLEASIEEHSLGLTPSQWETFYNQLTAEQQLIVTLFKSGRNLDAIASDLKLKTHQVMGEWSKLYLSAQAIRSEA